MIRVIGLGPGGRGGRSFQAEEALSSADIAVGYSTYIDLIKEDFPDLPVFQTGMTGETARCREAVRLSREGKNVAVVCSGDAGIYGMASLILELSDERDDVEIVPGISAAMSCSALLGAPLSGDAVIISLSDLLTPWALIEKRLDAAALGDFPMAIYNPASKKRADHLRRARDILLARQPGSTPCGWAKMIGRAGCETGLCDLSTLDAIPADMFTTVIVGCSRTVVKNGRLITLRGYRL